MNGKERKICLKKDSLYKERLIVRLTISKKMKLKKINQDIDSIQEKIRKKKRATKLKELQENRRKRKKRAVHLFILGNILKSAKIDNVEEDILLGYFLEFKNIDNLKKMEFNLLGKEILNQKKIEREKKREEFIKSFNENVAYEKRETKKEFSRMVKIGAIFEMAKIEKEDLATLVGFTLDYHNKNTYDYNRYLLSGKLFKLERKI